MSHFLVKLLTICSNFTDVLTLSFMSLFAHLTHPVGTAVVDGIEHIGL